METIKEFKKTKCKKVAVGTHFIEYLEVSIETLIKKLGSPSFVAPDLDRKIQLEWVFKKGNQVITIYDYKTNRSIYSIRQWQIGGKKVNKEDIHDFLIKHLWLAF